MMASGGRIIVPEDIDFDDDDSSVRDAELDAIELEEKQQATRAALAKFNFFLHITGYISCCAYLLILGILYRWALPYVFIPITLWTVGIGYHGYRAFHPKKKNDQ